MMVQSDYGIQRLVKKLSWRLSKRWGEKGNVVRSVITLMCFQSSNSFHNLDII